MPTPFKEYDIPDSWPAKDVVQWINATLREPGVKSVEFCREPGNLVVRIWFVKTAPAP